MTARRAGGSSSGLTTVVALALAWLFVSTLWIVATDQAQYQWDFNTYFLAGKAFSAGDDPYLLASLQKQASQPIDKPFLYPPLTLHFFAALASMPREAAYTLWLLAKLAMLAGLLWIWHRDLVDLRPAVLTVPFMVLAFNSTLLWDLEAGNVAIFEQFILWCGFAALFRGRNWEFAICVALAAQFKLLPQVLSVALLLVAPARGLKPFLASWAVFGSSLALGALMHPALTAEFFQAAAAVDERGHHTPCLLSLIRDIFDHARGSAAGTPSKTALVVYGLFALAICWRTAEVVLRRHVQERPLPPRFIAALLCIGFAVAAPRFKSYAYVQLLGPALYVLTLPVGAPLVDLALICAVFPGIYNPMPAHFMLEVFHDYFPWLAAVVLWLRAVGFARTSEPQGGRAASDAGELQGA
ncbi:MAG: DUF2029 domain-containing protein [Candidatus Wallbacteria bacterium]|nr:DUF2029 domain-containing protein [Candidatus Wallbacteria bacterium]